MLTFLKTAVDDASSDQRAKIGAIYAFLLAGNALTWTWRGHRIGRPPDAARHRRPRLRAWSPPRCRCDHIAAIDNVVRKLMQEGKRPVSVGLFFSLGHSLVVALAVAAIATAAFALRSHFHQFKLIGSIIGTGASAFFLLAIAVINLVVLRGVWASFRRARRGEPVADDELNLLLSGRGFLARIFGCCSAWSRAAGRCFLVVGLRFGSASTSQPK